MTENGSLPSARHGHPWRFNITPILGRYARTELVCPVPGVDLIMKCAVGFGTRTDAYKATELLNLEIEIKEVSNESRD